MHHRAKLRDRNDPYADRWLNCEKCMFEQTDRPGLKCAWVPQSQWPRDARTNPVPGEVDDSDLPCCPGYLVQLPQVIEAARASSWRSEGALSCFYDGPLTDLAKDAIDVVAGETRRVESYAMREATKGAGNG